MKKKKNIKRKSDVAKIEMTLPQNIMPMGERVLEDKNIYIHQRVYKQIHKFAKNKTENEHGGVLVGRIVNELGKENTIIEGFIEAKFNEATPTTLTFTHQTWEYFHSEIEKHFKNMKIVGWIHTHPNFGIFLSENDKFIQQNFFTDKNQVAYVVDPIQKEEGFFFWIEDKLERCPGFYLFDKNGAKINQIKEKTTDDENVVYKNSKWNVVLSIFLIILILINIFFIVTKSETIQRLEKDNKLLQTQMQKVINNQGIILQRVFPEIFEDIKEEQFKEGLDNVENGGEEQ